LTTGKGLAHLGLSGLLGLVGAKQKLSRLTKIIEEIAAKDNFLGCYNAKKRRFLGFQMASRTLGKCSNKHPLIK
jgi:hypothetical protein